MLTQIKLAQLLLWGPPTLNLLGMTSQIIHHYRLRSTHGMSFATLGFFHAATLTLCAYIYLIDLPFALKVMVPIEACAVTALVMQEMWYAPTLLFRAQILALHGSIVCCATMLWVGGLWYPWYIGYAAGWIATGCLAFVQLPQIIENWQRKSMHGLSTGILVYGTLSPILVLWCCYELSMPLPSWANAIRALGYRVIQWWQFVEYPRDR